jgi:hypothetical protein
MKEVPAWLALLSGMSLLSGVLGSVVTLAVTGLVFLVRRPKLRMTFTAVQRGCVVDTPSQGGQQRALRIFVENRGWTTAHNVNVSAIELAFYPQVGTPSGLVDEVLEFHLALSDVTRFDLAQGAHRWVDVVFADDLGQGVTLRLGFLVRPLRLTLLNFGQRGSYSFEVIATGDNASAKRQRINFHWDGSLRGLRIT